ncbi:hypothetical protein F4677DRAFT_447685 [Hypoxylon crocopeplum]|nr:hypothetical protein F4677DRAFT_447685 [Hypoxylon crocopeplum]
MAIKTFLIYFGFFYALGLGFLAYDELRRWLAEHEICTPWREFDLQRPRDLSGGRQRNVLYDKPLAYGRTPESVYVPVCYHARAHCESCHAPIYHHTPTYAHPSANDKPMSDRCIAAGNDCQPSNHLTRLY